MHYYHYRLDEVMNMTAIDYNRLAELMYVNEARDKLSEFEVSSYPKLKDEVRSDRFRKISKIAYPVNFEKKNVVKLSDIKRVINGR